MSRLLPGYAKTKPLLSNVHNPAVQAVPDNALLFHRLNQHVPNQNRGGNDLYFFLPQAEKALKITDDVIVGGETILLFRPDFLTADLYTYELIITAVVLITNSRDLQEIPRIIEPPLHQPQQLFTADLDKHGRIVEGNNFP